MAVSKEILDLIPQGCKVNSVWEDLKQELFESFEIKNCSYFTDNRSIEES